MKKIFFIFGAIISTLSTCFAELVPGASHILNFTDEEVEALQRLLWLKSPHQYESFFKAKIDPNILKKYPPHNLIQPEQNFASYEIKNKEGIFNYILTFSSLLDDFTPFAYYHLYFVYILLVMNFEKLGIPPYNYTTRQLYSTIVLGLHKILRNWPERLTNPKTFPKFRKNITLAEPGNEAIDSIFISINSNTKLSKCFIQ